MPTGELGVVFCGWVFGIQIDRYGGLTLFCHSGKILNGRSVIPLQSGCQLFLRYITRVNLDNPNFDDCIAGILERGKRFAELSLSARDKIADCGANFIQDGSVVLTHGCR